MKVVAEDNSFAGDDVIGDNAHLVEDRVSLDREIPRLVSYSNIGIGWGRGKGSCPGIWSR